MIATEPRMPAAAASAPSADSATPMIGTWPLSSSPRTSPVGATKNTRPSAPPATISPSRATATELSGVGSVIVVSGPPSSGQMRSVRS